MPRHSRTPPTPIGELSRWNLLQRVDASVGGSRPSGGFEFGSRLEERAERLRSVNFVEIAVVYDGLGGDEWPTTYSDDFVRYAVDDDRSVLFLNRATRQADLQVVKNNASVVRTDRRFVPASGVVLEGEPSGFLHTKLGDRTSVSRSVLLETEHRPPAVSVAVRDDQTAVVEVKDESYEVGPGEESRVELDEETVEVRRKSTDVKEVEDPKVPGETTLVRGMGTVETVPVTPTVVVRNSGQVTAYRERT